jgi:hypothetical protein
MGIRSCDLRACSIVAQPTTLPRVPFLNSLQTINWVDFGGRRKSIVLLDGSQVSLISPADKNSKRMKKSFVCIVIVLKTPVQSNKLLLALGHIVVLCFMTQSDSWPYCCSFQAFTCFEIGPPLRQEEGSDCYWVSPLYRTVTLPPLSLNLTHCLTFSTFAIARSV